MGVRSTKDIVREARHKAGLTQEQMADGMLFPPTARTKSGDSYREIAAVLSASTRGIPVEKPNSHASQCSTINKSREFS